MPKNDVFAVRERHFGFFEMSADHFWERMGATVAVCKDWPTAKTIPRGMEMAKKFGLEILPPPGA